MKKSTGAVTETGRNRCLFAAFAMIFFVAGLIGGVEAFAPFAEMDDIECAPTLEAVLAEPRVLKDDDVVRPARCRPKADRRPRTFSRTASGPADSQVLSPLRDGGRQRAARPTGPPVILA